MLFSLVCNLAIFILLIISLSQIGKHNWSLSRKVFLGLILGVLFGLGLQLVYGVENKMVGATLNWISIVGSGYVKLLQMVIMPLVFASILSAVARLHNASSLGKISVLTIGVLLLTTAISCLVAVFVTGLFHLSASGLVQGVQETARLNAIQTRYASDVADLTAPQLILSLLPKNPFYDLTGASPTAIISVVIFAVFLGIAAIQLLKDAPEKGQRVLAGIEILQAWVGKLVRLIMRLTPYGVLALMTNVVASSNPHQIIKLGSFMVASYLGLLIMFVIHALLLGFNGINPLRYFQKVWPVLSFAFTSRSSAACIPLSIEAQTQRLGTTESIASFSASFGATIGQNGCAGLYPAMLAVMIAPVMGINPFDPTWIAALVGIVTLSSVGVAGVGGGATFAALIVLPALGLPVTLVALLISIEPLIDMGRTALNVNGSILAGTLTSRWLGQTNLERMNRQGDDELNEH